MIKLLKNIVNQWITLFKYGSVVQGGSVLIRQSEIAKKDVVIFGDTIITGSTLKPGTRIHSFCIITNSTIHGNKIGNSSNIGNSKIGEHSYVADFAMLNRTVIGKFCSIGPGFKCGLGAHPHNFISSSPYFYQGLSITGKSVFEEYADTQIGNDVWIGANVFIKDGVTVGDGAIIAAGSVVLKDVESFSIVGGVPAKLIRYRHSPDVLGALKILRWWDRDTEWLHRNREFFQKEIISVADLDGLNV